MKGRNQALLQQSDGVPKSPGGQRCGGTRSPAPAEHPPRQTTKKLFLKLRDKIIALEGRYEKLTTEANQDSAELLDFRLRSGCVPNATMEKFFPIFRDQHRDIISRMALRDNPSKLLLSRLAAIGGQDIYTDASEYSGRVEAMRVLVRLAEMAARGRRVTAGQIDRAYNLEVVDVDES
jgi:hypothetical protein